MFSGSKNKTVKAASQKPDSSCLRNHFTVFENKAIAGLLFAKSANITAEDLHCDGKQDYAKKFPHRQ